MKVCEFTESGKRLELYSPTAMPAGSTFLWNKKLLLQLNCRGYATAQFMQPEPAKYAHAPNLEAKTFMQPEQPYYAHHPGRFFYVKERGTDLLFSAPYEPARVPLDRFAFSVGLSDVVWEIEKHGLLLRIEVSLAPRDPVELWKVTVQNLEARGRTIDLYPYFPIGYMSWMNQSAQYDPDLRGIVASSVTPYQKVADYFKNKELKDKTFLVADQSPVAWEARQAAFEGEGGLHYPSSLQKDLLSNSDALYETPTAVMQFRFELGANQEHAVRLMFGPACDEQEIVSLRKMLLEESGFSAARTEYTASIQQGRGCLEIKTPDPELDSFVNHWLPRQIFYHGDVNRLTTDPQTRNYLQDNMGMSYIKPDVARGAFVKALSQQESSGAMPDGILLSEGAELKYINQVPHTDHCVWLPVCLQAYLHETNDYALLHEPVVGREGTSLSVFERITRAMRWLLEARDERGLSLIAQGDWCDPMNMVGYQGKGVSGWLSIATAYALNLWAEICELEGASHIGREFRTGAAALNRAVNEYLWDGNWFGRGISDDGVAFGVSRDQEGRIFLNCQSWAMLSGAAEPDQQQKLMKAIEEQLETPYGPQTLAPPYTRMRENVGRITQKFPGSAENGSVYNHDAAFYVFALYSIGDCDRAFRVLRQMLPGPSEADYLRRGQLPVFIPNYYRGAWREHPRTAGRSSQLFNTGTVAWLYRCLLEGLFGLKGCREGLLVQPHLPSSWTKACVSRRFRGATFTVNYERRSEILTMRVLFEGTELPGQCITEFKAGKVYQIEVLIPAK